jgi:hypothetical protein
VQDDCGDAQPGCALLLPRLPLPALTNVLLRLPLDERLRCAEVCRGWRGMVAERSLWMHLDVSAASLGAPCRASDALLRAGAARALRNVRSVDVSGVLRDGDGDADGDGVNGSVSVRALCELAAQNPGLRVIRALGRGAAAAEHHSLPALRALLQAAPRLAELHADARAASVADALPLVRNEAPLYGPLRLNRLCVTALENADVDDAGVEDQVDAGAAVLGFFTAGLPSAEEAPPAALAALLAALPAHAAPVRHLALPRPGPRGLHAGVNAALALALRGCAWRARPGQDMTRFSSAGGGADQLTRLLTENADALTELHVNSLNLDSFSMPYSFLAFMGAGGAVGALTRRAEAEAHVAASLMALCAALRGSRLTALTLHGFCLHNAAAAGPLLCALAAALTGHPTLATLSLRVPLRGGHGGTLDPMAMPLVPNPGAPPAALPGVGAALAALASGGGGGAQAQAAGALTRLDVSGCAFLDDELAPLFAALAAGEAPRLRALDVGGAQLRESFVRAVVAPAAAAAASATGGCLEELWLTPRAVLGVPAEAAGSGAERAVRARAAARAASAARRFVFAAEHAPLCRAAPGDEVDKAAVAAAAAAAAAAADGAPPPPLAPLARALARAPGLSRVVLGGAFASALASGALRGCDAAALLRALAGHPDLEVLTLEGDLREFGAALGEALGTLVAADSPALSTVRVAGCSLGDAGLGPLVAALPRNSHLRALECNGSALGAAFAREALLPAVRANSGLRELSAENALSWRLEGVTAAMACVRARGQHAPGSQQQ